MLHFTKECPQPLAPEDNVPDLVGQTLKGRYRIESFIGRGGMAGVYKAWDTGRQYHVAIKILREDLAEDLEFVRRFRKEAEALARLDHRNIVRFYSFEREGALAFIVMDFVPGASLRRRILEAGGQPLGAGEIANTLRQVGRALHYAHAQGFIHRDVKPGNILITPDGQILLSDFGIARGIETSTITQGQVGTPAYMSPEQVTGGELDGRSDIYSLGVVLYEMATGRRPFDGAGGQGATTTERVCWEQMHRPIPDPRSANPTLSAAQAAVIARALAKDRAERWPTACRSPLFAHCFTVARRQPRTRRNFATPPYVLVLRRTKYAPAGSSPARSAT